MYLESMATGATVEKMERRRERERKEKERRKVEAEMLDAGDSPSASKPELAGSAFINVPLREDR